MDKKDHIDWFTHDSHADQHGKFKMLRMRYGWEGEGRFWALCCMIGRAPGCWLDLGKKYTLASTAVDLGMDETSFHEFVEHLKPEECNLILVDGEKISTEEAQQCLRKVLKEREQSRRRQQRRRGKGADHGAGVPEGSQDVTGDTAEAGQQCDTGRHREAKNRTGAPRQPPAFGGAVFLERVKNQLASLNAMCRKVETRCSELLATPNLAPVIRNQADTFRVYAFAQKYIHEGYDPMAIEQALKWLIKQTERPLDAGLWGAGLGTLKSIQKNRNEEDNIATNQAYKATIDALAQDDTLKRLLNMDA